MAETSRLAVPFAPETGERLRAGDWLLLSGVVYAARDAAHQRLCETLRRGLQPPFPLAGQVIYYVGPTPARPGEPIGSAGPTTAARLDAYLELLLLHGLLATIGKGRRTPAAVELHRQQRRVYFMGLGGAGALLGRRIRSARVLAYDDLGPEAVRELVLEDFPVVVGIDAEGNDATLLGQKRYARP
jgi:fumarate hydratase subunit beta